MRVSVSNAYSLLLAVRFTCRSGWNTRLLSQTSFPHAFNESENQWLRRRPALSLNRRASDVWYLAARGKGGVAIDLEFRSGWPSRPGRCTCTCSVARKTTRTPKITRPRSCDVDALQLAWRGGQSADFRERVIADDRDQ